MVNVISYVTASVCVYTAWCKYWYVWNHFGCGSSLNALLELYKQINRRNADVNNLNNGQQDSLSSIDMICFISFEWLDRFVQIYFPLKWWPLFELCVCVYVIVSYMVIFIYVLALINAKNHAHAKRMWNLKQISCVHVFLRPSHNYSSIAYIRHIFNGTEQQIRGFFYLQLNQLYILSWTFIYSVYFYQWHKLKSLPDFWNDYMFKRHSYTFLHH